MKNENLCPCCSGKTYAECCKPFHEGALPETALLLMRSRYSAYALNLPDYIIETTHPRNAQYAENKAQWRQSISHFSKITSFPKLVILEFKENQNSATVTFTAHLLQDGRDASFTEKSSFEKVNNRWLYLSGV
jgi:SEC-C motif domain protein